MRTPHIDKINSLKKLSDLREAMLTSELALKRAAMSRKVSEIRELKSRIPKSETVQEIAAYALWQRWKEQELRRLNTEHAILRANHDRCARAVGRAVAENSVLDHLKEVSQTATKKQMLREQENAFESHLLTHNIGDQDV